MTDGKYCRNCVYWTRTVHYDGFDHMDRGMCDSPKNPDPNSNHFSATNHGCMDWMPRQVDIKVLNTYDLDKEQTYRVVKGSRGSAKAKADAMNARFVASRLLSIYFDESVVNTILDMPNDDKERLCNALERMNEGMEDE